MKTVQSYWVWGSHRHELSQRTWKTLEDVGRRCWKTWGSLAKSLGRRDFDLKKKKSFFSFFNSKFTSSKRFREASPRLPATSSNVFQRLPCALRQVVAMGSQNLIFLHGDTRVPVRKVGTQRTKPYQSDPTQLMRRELFWPLSGWHPSRAILGRSSASGRPYGVVAVTQMLPGCRE